MKHFFSHFFTFKPVALFCLYLSSLTILAKDLAPAVGVFYFPGWHDGAPGLVHPVPWAPIKKYAEREPALGWYDDADPAVLAKQLYWMKQYGVDFVIFDWYWNTKGTYLDQSILAYKSLRTGSKIPFSVMWANHDQEPRSEQSFRDVVDYWIDNYFTSSDYLKIDGKPVVYIFQAEDLELKLKAAGTNSLQMFENANQKAKKAGLPGIYFVGGTGGGGVFPKQGRQYGYSAYFAYNYHSGLGGKIDGQPRASRSFSELAAGYEEQQHWFLENSDAPYMMPVTTGWDRTPWGGSRNDPLHDNSISSPESFEAHLFRSAALATENPSKSLNTVTICCWNEYGEGSILEPTKKFGFRYLESVKKVSPGMQLPSSN
ncbi:glycoside hydrolase family 99-like domain-containing protein [Hydrocarboniphaga sp.]|uniref:glycoside hydrolase family 99-like domain-containing protein n=1 Tax=Hydrocarboniphaga sp. TaxID=2033016 RepID=UPI002AB84766|nr:glycoside hydrolase family 99-like domain-containing protein [Hydrocarboniphaga sp.]MDZ4078362.1 glycoside hydrolase family 99-like domain-containing protein [Hydrocarboniphaga sp.]